MWDSWKCKIIRKIYGGKRIKDLWERRTNSELTELYRVPVITAREKAQRIKWLGHVWRMKNRRQKQQEEGKDEGDQEIDR